MGNIFEIQKEYLELMENLEQLEGEMTPELEASLIINEKDWEEKATNYIRMIRKWESDVSAIDTEIKRLQNIKKSKLGPIDRLKENMKTSMLMRGLGMVDLGLSKLSFRKSTSLVVDESILPKKWFNKKVVMTPDKVGLKAYLKTGKTVAGVTEQVNENLQIK